MTLQREVKQKLKRDLAIVLEQNGIYTEALPGDISIVDKAVNKMAHSLFTEIEFFARAAAIDRLPKVGKTALDMARKRLMLAERIEAQLQIIPDHKEKKWERVLNWIIDEEEKGNSFDKYVEWFKAGNDYNRPKTFQIFKNPALIKGNWKEAQAFNKQETQARAL